MPKQQGLVSEQQGLVSEQAPERIGSTQQFEFLAQSELQQGYGQVNFLGRQQRVTTDVPIVAERHLALLLQHRGWLPQLVLNFAHAPPTPCPASSDVPPPMPAPPLPAEAPLLPPDAVLPLDPPDAVLPLAPLVPPFALVPPVPPLEAAVKVLLPHALGTKRTTNAAARVSAKRIVHLA